MTPTSEMRAAAEKARDTSVGLRMACRDAAESGSTIIVRPEDVRPLLDEVEALRARVAEVERDAVSTAEKHFLETERAMLRAEAAEADSKRLREALEPFARYLDTARYDLDSKGNPLPDDQGMGWVYLTVGDFRRACTAPETSHDHGRAG